MPVDHDVQRSRRYFCTYFDHLYLPRGLAMYRSLKLNCPSAQLWVLCLSDDCYDTLTRLAWPDVVPIKLADFEKGDDALRRAKANRSRIEYYFTCTPSLLLFVLRQNLEIDLLTYIDADLCFFAEPEPIYQEMGQQSIAIIGHRFPPELSWKETYGVFNVGWLSFRRNEEGLASLTWWRERCLEWCYDYVDGDRFADQKYLDKFPQMFPNVQVIKHKGANLAPWNLGNYHLNTRNGILCVDDQPVLFFHFHGFRKIALGVVDPSLSSYGLKISWLMEWKLFRPYLRKLRQARRLVAGNVGTVGLLEGLRHGGAAKTVGTRLWELQIAYRGVLRRRYLLALGF